MDNGVLIGFVNISGRLMPNHKFFHSLVTALALDFFPPPDCNFFLPPIATFTVWISNDFLSYFSSASLFSVPAEHVMLEIMANVFIIVGIVGDKSRSQQIKDRGDHGLGTKELGVQNTKQLMSS